MDQVGSSSFATKKLNLLAQSCSFFAKENGVGYLSPIEQASSIKIKLTPVLIILLSTRIERVAFGRTNLPIHPSVSSISLVMKKSIFLGCDGSLANDGERRTTCFHYHRCFQRLGHSALFGLFKLRHIAHRGRTRSSRKQA